MAERVLLTVVGEAGSGKSEACRYLSQQWGFWVVYPGQIIRDLAGRPITRQEAPSMLLELRERFGADFLLRPVAESGYDRICIDGNRAPYEHDALIAMGAVKVLLYCQGAERFQRENFKRVARGEPSLTDLDEFRATQSNDYGNNDPFLPSVDKVIAEPDFSIDTTKVTRRQLYGLLDSIVLQQLNETR